MLRVRSSFLIPDESGRLGYRDVPFSGLAYEVGEDGVLRAIRTVEDGRITGPSADWLDLPEGGLRVDWAVLERIEDYGRLLFRGEPFTGLAYFFTGSGVCLAEVEHVEGLATEESQREWYPDGALREQAGGGEFTAWLPDGRLQRRAPGGVVVYSLFTQDDGRLGGILLRDPVLFDLGAVSAMTPADEFLLIGRAVDAELLRLLYDHAGLGAVRRLRLVETGIGPEGVEVIAGLESLAELWLQDNPHLGPAEVRRLGELRPGLVVHLENSEP